MRSKDTRSSAEADKVHSDITQCKDALSKQKVLFTYR